MSRSTQEPYFLAKGSVSWKEKPVLSLVPRPADYFGSVGRVLPAGQARGQGKASCWETWMLLGAVLPKGLSRGCG